MIKIQTTIVGFNGEPITMLSVYDQDSRILAISNLVSYKRERLDGCLVITNDHAIDRDSLFVDDDLKPAINAYFAMKGGISIDGKSSRLVFSDKATRATPSIEKDGYDEGGVKYRINENVSCAQIATLATALYADTKASNIDASFDFMDSLNKLGIGDILTI